jgi:hypothetical protein
VCVCVYMCVYVCLCVCVCVYVCVCTALELKSIVAVRQAVFRNGYSSTGTRTTGL